MGIISIAGTLILNGDILTSDEVRVETLGLIIPVPKDLIETIYSCPIKDFHCQNGKTPTITSTESGIQILGNINGVGQGFPPNEGPGANSTLLDNQNEVSEIYGATHAGLGSVSNILGNIELIEEEFTVHSINLIQKGIDLSYQPLSNIAVNIIHGPSQLYGVDFVLNGDFLSWSGLALEFILSVGDVIRVVYYADTTRYFPLPKDSYGSYEAPTSIGSGSGEVSGGSGIKLVAQNGYININGVVNLSGESGASSRTGGGSGGSFWASAYNLTGAGTIIADGGDAFYTYAGGGGGGYITLNYENQNSFQGIMSVAGKKGGTEGVITVKKIEPFFIEKFTGTILNPKWWEITQEPVEVNNAIYMNTLTGDWRSPRLDSLFHISGKNIQVDCDFIPSGLEPSYHTSYFKLYQDDLNWVSVARKHNNIFGIYTVGGDLYQTAIPYDYTNTTFRILKSDSTFSFQIVDPLTGPATIMSETIPELNGANFKVLLGTQKDEPDSSNYVSDYFKLTNVDEANGYVTLAGIPIDASYVSLNVVGGGSQIYGYDYTVSSQKLYWNPLNLYLQEDDEIIASYANDTTFNDLNISWDNFKVFNGILSGIETTEPILYVDPIYGSDTSNGTVLNPLKNLFVATAWAKKGSTVVLYNGTHAPTEVLNKNLTIQGAYGQTQSLISTANVQDTTGSNWENSCLTFRNCQGQVKNIKFTRAVDAIFTQNAQNIEVSGCTFQDVTTAIKFTEYSKNCSVLSNIIHDTSAGVVFDTQIYNPVVYSNVIYDSSVAVVLLDASRFVVSSNTFDSLNVGVLTDNSSAGFISSNNITNSTVAIYLNGDTSAGLFNNNFYGTTSINLGTGTLTDSTNNTLASPAYVNQYLRNYHLLSFSADRSSGTDLFDYYFVDKDGAKRKSAPSYDIGAYQYSGLTHASGAFFVDTSGDDYLNSGNSYSPYRTLDKAMSVANAPIYISSILIDDQHLDESSNPYFGRALGGHYDSIFLNLKDQNIYFVDASRQIQTYTLDSNYSNINFGVMLFVSPSGSDSTIMGGDGTDSGGDGSIQKPFRTIARALEASSSGDYIVALSGEYPLFNGRDGRVVVPTGDRTGISEGRMFIEDLFYTPLEDLPGRVLEESSWDFSVG